MLNKAIREACESSQPNFGRQVGIIFKETQQ